MESDSCYQKNVATLLKRWPAIAHRLEQIDIDYSQFELLPGDSPSLVCNNIQINSSYDSEAEAELITGQIPKHIAHIHQYGIGNGQVLRSFLARGALQAIDIYLFNWMLFKLSLRVFDYEDVFLDSRVEFNLAEHSSYAKSPFVVIPPELIVIDDNASILRDRVCLSLDTQYIDEHRDFNNDIIIEKIARNMQTLVDDDDISTLTIGSHYEFVVVAGAGPTLSSHFDWLKENRNRFFLIAVDAAMRPFYKENIRPDLICSIDPIGGDLFGEIDNEFLRDIPLLYFPLLEPNFIKQWKGKRYASFSTGESFEQLAQKVPKTRLYSAGSVIHPSVDAAVVGGAKKVILLGADFSFIDNQMHSTNTQQFSHFNPMLPNECKHWVLNGYGEKNPTYLNFRGYLRDLESYIQLHNDISFFNGSLFGAQIKGAPLWQEFVTND